MQDQFKREISYLRLSITDRCNFRCRYCLPPEGIRLHPQAELLRFEELQRLVGIGVQSGIRRVRVTGGEPLVRRGVVDFLASLGAVPGLGEIALTTNGSLLAGQAAELRRAGVGEINISLDTLRPERFAELTRGGDWHQVWEGIMAALEQGFQAVKLNTVLLGGLNDDELVELAALTERYPLAVRFIELMPLGEAGGVSATFVSAAKARERLVTELGLEPEPGPSGKGPAVYYRRPGSPGRVGFIGALTEHFCTTCNRLRLTAQGQLIPCLGQEVGLDLRTPLRSGGSDAELFSLWQQALQLKPEGHRFGLAGGLGQRMSRLGG